MHFDITDFVDLVASLALVLVPGFALAWSTRRQDTSRVSEILLGALYGLAAAAQMLRPFEPTDGVIIDLRCIPIALAGAFLGPRGALTCLGLATLTRLQIGGLGLWPGIVSMCLALAGGMLWAIWTRGVTYRGPIVMLALSFMMSAHFLGVLMLPPHVMQWFLHEAALPILVVNLVSVTCAALMLEVQVRSAQEEEKLRDAARIEPESGLLTKRAFQRECNIRASALANASYTYALIIEVRPCARVLTWIKRADRHRLLAAMHMRLKHEFLGMDLACIHGDRTLVVSLTQETAIMEDELLMRVRRITTDTGYNHGGDNIRVGVDARIVELPQEDTLDSLFVSSKSRYQPQEAEQNRVKPGSFSSCGTQLPAPSPAKVDRLFAKANFLIGHDLKRTRERVSRFDHRDPNSMRSALPTPLALTRNSP